MIDNAERVDGLRSVPALRVVDPIDPIDPIDVLHAAVDGLLADRVGGLSDADLLGRVCAVELVRRRLAAADHAVIAELDARRVGPGRGFASTRDLLAARLGIPAGEAGARVAAAGVLAPRRHTAPEPAGAAADGAPRSVPVEPVFPLVAAARRAGQLSAGQAAVITDCITGLPDGVRDDLWDHVEADLCSAAVTGGPRGLAAAARRISMGVDPDAAARTDAEHRRRRGLTLSAHRDGSGRISGYLTAGCLARARAVLDALAAPVPAVDGTPDPRTAAQRMHDAFDDLTHRALADDGLPGSGGIPATLVITMTEQDFTARQGTATTAHGDPITVPEALTLADQALVQTVVLSAAGGILSYGRDRRCATPAQRLALVARDRGCSFPGCTTPATWCESHHLIPWQHGGRTSVENMALLCGYHHRTFEALGWRTVTDHHGVPWWIPPRRIDPDQKPTRNHTHHPQ